MYILEINHINNHEDLFFSDSNLVTEQEEHEFFENAKQKFSKNLYQNKLQTTTKRFRREDGAYQRVTKRFFFKSIQAAEDYYKEVIADGTNYSKVRRDWHQQHKIINETNIVDMNGKIIRTPHSCQGNTCLRFGTCPTTSGGGCDVISEKSAEPISYHISLSSIKKLVG
jgi:hypothetical protein